ncbi:MAG: DUF4055 domain-containing protein, partial [Georgenia sp.]
MPTDTPATPSATYSKRLPQWTRLRTLFRGTDAVHEAGDTLLFRFAGESDADFKRRKEQTAFDNYFRRTVRALVGLIFRRPPTLGKDVSAVIVGQAEDIDGAGTALNVLARMLATDGMITGLGGILVDYPTVADPDGVSLAVEQAAGLRPYWVRYRAEDVLVARVGRVGNRTVYTLLVLRETVEEQVGLFGVAEITRYRVFRHTAETGVTFELWEEREGVDEKGKTATLTVMTQEPRPVLVAGKRPISAIPFAPLVAGETEDAGLQFDCDPPLLDLADLNLDHYRVKADRRNVMTMACTVTPYRIGYEGDANIILGPSVSIDIPSPEGKVGLLELTGTAFVPTERELDMIVRAMAALALAMLDATGTQPETAEAKRIDSAAQNASLATVAQALQDCLERALGFHAEYLGEVGGSITVN